MGVHFNVYFIYDGTTYYSVKAMMYCGKLRGSFDTLKGEKIPENINIFFGNGELKEFYKPECQVATIQKLKELVLENIEKETSLKSTYLPTGETWSLKPLLNLINFLEKDPKIKILITKD